jgi:hypothetical protein
MVRMAAVLILALGLAACGAVDSMTEGFKHAKAVESDLEATTGHCPFILPMSGRSWRSTTGIIHISAARSWCVAWSIERRAIILACKGRQASWYRSPVGCSIL